MRKVKTKTKGFDNKINYGLFLKNKNYNYTEM